MPSAVVSVPRTTPSRTGLWAMLLFLLTLVAYIPATRAGFIWDDDLVLTANATIRAPDGLYRIWFTRESVDYFPLTYSMFWVEWRLWGQNPLPYHLINVLLHATSAVLLWRILLRLNVPGAWIGAALFALHPVAAGTVAWVVERKNTLPMALSLGAVLSYLHWQSHPRWRWYALSLGLFLMALLAKTAVVGVPIVLLLLTWWKRNSLRWRDVAAVLPMVACGIALGLVTVHFQTANAIAGHPVRPEGILSRIAATGWVLWFYLGKIIWPGGLCMVYPRWQVNPASPLAWLPLAGILFLAATLWWKRSVPWVRSLFVAIASWIVILGPVLGLVKMSWHQYSLVADHLQYVALPPILALAGAMLHRIRRHRLGVFLLPAAVGGLLLVLGLLTLRRAGDFTGRLTLWRHDMSIYPNSWMAHHGMGEALVAAGLPDLALGHYERSLALNSRNSIGLNNVANELSKEGRYTESLPHYYESLRQVPNNPTTLFNLGGALSGTGRREEALAVYREVLALRPGWSKPHNNMGVVLVDLGRREEAVEQFALAVQADPRDSDSLSNLAMTLIEVGRPREAMPHLRRLAEIDPDAPAKLNAAAGTLALGALEAGRYPEGAVEIGEILCGLTEGRSAGALDTLAAAYAVMGRFTDAVAAIDRAMAIAEAQGQEKFWQQLARRREMYARGQAPKPVTTRPASS